VRRASHTYVCISGAAGRKGRGESGGVEGGWVGGWSSSSQNGTISRESSDHLFHTRGRRTPVAPRSTPLRAPARTMGTVTIIAIIAETLSAARIHPGPSKPRHFDANPRSSLRAPNGIFSRSEGAALPLDRAISSESIKVIQQARKGILYRVQRASIRLETNIKMESQIRKTGPPSGYHIDSMSVFQINVL